MPGLVWPTVRTDCNSFDICVQSYAICRQHCCWHCHGSCISLNRLPYDTASGDCHFWAFYDDNSPNAVPQDHFQANNSSFTDPYLDFFTEYVTYSAVLDHLDSTQTLTHERRMEAIYIYNNCCFVYLEVLPLILLAIVYVRIFLVLRSQLKRIRR